jgi:hypothetical protein
MRKMAPFFCCVLMLFLTSYAGASPARHLTPRMASNVVKPKKNLTIASAAAITNDISINGYFMNQAGQGLTATNLANALVGQGVQISNVTSNCADKAAGSFTINGDVGIGLMSGIILSTGLIDNVIGPNISSDITNDNGMSGDSDLDELIPEYQTFDACVLEFDFVPQTSTVSFKYAFASEEYNEFVGTDYNDVFGFFIDGVNCAKINNSIVSINNINSGSNSGYYVDNTSAVYNTEMDGFTKVMNCSAAVQTGQTHHLKLAIADAGDSILDSNVFIGTQSLVSEQYGLFLSPDALTKTASCGAAAVYELDLQNLGSLSDSYNLTLSNPQWSTVFASTGTNVMTVGPLSSLATTKVTVNVSIPVNTCSGNDSVIVTATSVASPTIRAMSSLSTTADTNHLLTVTIDSIETGSGTVNSTSPSSPSITCLGSCSAIYPYGTPVMLKATPSWHSITSWSGCTASGNDCSVLMNSDMTVNATFYPIYTVKRTGTSTSEYATLQSAYNDSATGDTIQAQALTYFEDLILNLPVEVKLDGGFDGSYLPATGFTSIDGSLKISKGKVICNKVIIK